MAFGSQPDSDSSPEAPVPHRTTPVAILLSMFPL